MMARFLCTMLILVFTFSCNKRQKHKSPYFEGLVESTIHVHSSTAALDSFIYKKIGHNVTTYIQDSFVCRIYSTTDNIIVSREIFRSDSMKLYEMQEGSDTIMVTDLKNDYYNVNISTKDVGSKTILGKRCLQVLVTNAIRASMFSQQEVATMTYVFDTSLQLGPFIHHNVKYGSYDKVFSKYHFLTVGYEFKMSGAEFYVEAKRIVRSHINPIVFEIPKNKILVDPYLR